MHSSREGKQINHTTKTNPLAEKIASIYMAGSTVVVGHFPTLPRQKPKRTGTRCIQCNATIPPGRPRRCKTCREPNRTT